MLEKTPAPLGHALQGVRAGLDKLVWEAEVGVQAPDTVQVSSSAFADGGGLPMSCTADGAGASPPIAWRGAPAATASVVLVVEDADSPTPVPIMHALVYDLSGGDGEIATGLMSEPAPPGFTMGKNSYRKESWLPPDPPTGHGPHRYVFQLYALDVRPDLKAAAEKGDVLRALDGHVLARGRLTGVYERPG